MFLRKSIWIFSTICLFLACDLKVLPPETRLDSPLNHVRNGNTLLWKGKIDEAFYEFNRAKELNSEYAPAYIGLGLVAAYTGDYEKGLKTMQSARKYAQGDNQQFDVHVGFMRLYLIGRSNLNPEWLKLVEDEFSQAIHIAPNSPELYYYMGLAFKMTYELSKAADQFKKVLDLNKKFVKEADKEYALLQKVKSAKPESFNGKKIALKAQINRADVAALFIEELKIDQYVTTLKKIDQPSTPSQQKQKTDQNLELSLATDIHDHELKDDINAVIAYEIKGLRLFPDQTFKPYQMITRSEYALMIEDILIKITGDIRLATLFKDKFSPFPDVKNDQLYFNAIVMSTNSGIMIPKDLATGEFDPLGPLSGIEALMGIRTLQSQI